MALVGSVPLPSSDVDKIDIYLSFVSLVRLHDFMSLHLCGKWGHWRYWEGIPLKILTMPRVGHGIDSVNNVSTNSVVDLS